MQAILHYLNSIVNFHIIVDFRKLICSKQPLFWTNATALSPRLIEFFLVTVRFCFLQLSKSNFIRNYCSFQGLQMQAKISSIFINFKWTQAAFGCVSDMHSWTGPDWVHEIWRTPKMNIAGPQVNFSPPQKRSSKYLVQDKGVSDKGVLQKVSLSKKGRKKMDTIVYTS